MIIIGLDPATGASSPFGIFVYNSDTLEIMFLANVTYKHADVDRRIKKITDQLRPIFEMLDVYGPDVLVCVEAFIMKGRAGQMLQQMIGAALSLVPDNAGIQHVQNTTVKLIVGGTGKAEKIQVAYGVKEFFKTNKESLEIIEHLINMQEFDILDSAAIAIAGHIQCKNPTVKKPKSKKRRALKSNQRLS